MAGARVTVLGLGRMGAAVAGALLAAGHDLTVWNRDPARAFGYDGRARIATTPAAACAASDLILVCLADYAAGLEVLDEASEGTDFGGRCLVQLSTGTPSDARTVDAWSRMHGLRYLDGAILGPASAIGSIGVQMFFAGDERAYAQHEATLRALGPATHFVGSACGAAAALHCALLDYYYGAALGLLHGAALCESEDFPLGQYFKLAGGLGALLGQTADSARAMVDRENYSGIDCTLDTHVAALRQVQRLSHDNEVDPRLPDVLVQIYRKALAARHGGDELPAVFEVLRRAHD